MLDLDTMCTRVHAQSCSTILIAREIADFPEAQVAFIVANLEGTLAGAVKILGAEAAFNAVQPLVDRMLSPALGRA
jgi:hypothetical protein